MNTLIKSYVDMLNLLHEECKATLQGLNTKQLDWRPVDGENSIAVLAAHIAGAEKFWVGDCIMQTSSNRDRPAEFSTSGVDPNLLIQKLDESLDYVRTALTQLSDNDLSGHRSHPRTGAQITVAWALSHVIQHTALHLGHMQITRQLMTR